MTVEQFLKSLSDLMWTSYWAILTYKLCTYKKK